MHKLVCLESHGHVICGQSNVEISPNSWMDGWMRTLAERRKELLRGTQVTQRPSLHSGSSCFSGGLVGRVSLATYEGSPRVGVRTDAAVDH